MAVSVNNPWAAGAVVFDQRPYLAFYERQMAKDQAKNDALENYFKDLNKNITSTGMRSQDIPSFLQKNKDWQDHYIQNKSAILNPKLDNGEAYRKYMAGYQDQLAHANLSKSAQKDMDELGKLKFNKDFGYVFDDPDINKNIDAANLPVDDPNYKRFDTASAIIPPKPIDVKDREAFSKYVVGDAKPDKIPGVPIMLPGFQTQTPITQQYSDQNKKTFGDRAAEIYDTDRNWKYDAKKLFDQVKIDPVLHDQLNKIYKKYYGNEIDNPREAFIAKSILDHDIKTTEYEKGKDELGLAKEMAALRHQYSMIELEARQKLKDKSDQQQNTIIDKAYDDLKVDAIKNKAPYYPGQGAPYEQFQMKASGAVKKMFAIPDEKGHLIYPDAIRYSKDFTTVTPIFLEHKYLEDDKGNTIKSEEVKKDSKGNAKVIKELSQPILESEFKQRWKKEIMGAGAYGKQLNKSADDDGGDDGEDVNIESFRAKYGY